MTTDAKDPPTGDIVFYCIVTVIFMATSAFGAFEGWYSSGLSEFDGGPSLSGSVSVALAALYGTLFAAGCSMPFILVIFAVRLGSITNRRIASIWVVGVVSACCFAAILMSLTRTFFSSSEDYRYALFALAAAAPPGLQGLRLIIHIAQNE